MERAADSVIYLVQEAVVMAAPAVAAGAKKGESVWIKIIQTTLMEH